MSAQYRVMRGLRHVPDRLSNHFDTGTIKTKRFSGWVRLPIQHGYRINLVRRSHVPLGLLAAREVLYWQAYEV